MSPWLSFLWFTCCFNAELKLFPFIDLLSLFSVKMYWPLLPWTHSFYIFLFIVSEVLNANLSRYWYALSDLSKLILFWLWGKRNLRGLTKRVQGVKLRIHSLTWLVSFILVEPSIGLASLNVSKFPSESLLFLVLVLFLEAFIFFLVFIRRAFLVKLWSGCLILI